jgi:hypothetical protein
MSKHLIQHKKTPELSKPNEHKPSQKIDPDDAAVHG